MWVHKHILKNSDISTIRFTHTHSKFLARTMASREKKARSSQAPRVYWWYSRFMFGVSIRDVLQKFLWSNLATSAGQRNRLWTLRILAKWLQSASFLEPARPLHLGNRNNSKRSLAQPVQQLPTIHCAATSRKCLRGPPIFLHGQAPGAPAFRLCCITFQFSMIFNGRRTVHAHFRKIIALFLIPCI